jgi:EAL domain-containing protein (putative c-di-GMP-specific phosphodiesterase class I)
MGMRVTDSERDFLHELHRIKRDPFGKRIIHYCVSLAPADTDTPKRLERARGTLRRAFAHCPYLEIFSLSNGDILVACSRVSVAEVLAVSSEIEALFLGGDKVSVRNPYNDYAFYKIADAVKELDKVFSAFKAVLTQAQTPIDGIARRPIAPDTLAILSERLRTADLRPCIASQPVFRLDDGDRASVAYVEFYISTRRIEEAFMPEVNLVASPWLFNAVKEHFDRAILDAMAGRRLGSGEDAFAINLSLPAILSREFSDFYRSLPPAFAGRIVVEIDKTDLLQHFSLYRDVLALAASKGLRLCIDGVEWQDFDLLGLGGIAPDFVKVIWHNDLLTAGEDALTGMRALIASKPRTGFVLTHCEVPQALPFARTHGFGYVQGHVADQVLA